MKHATLVVALLALSACQSTPTTIVSGPMTARPLTTEQMQAVPNNGAIYQPSAFRPVFEDRRARHVGDVLTLVITERTSANKSGTATGNKSGSVSATVPARLAGTFGNPLTASSNNTYSDGDTQAASNAFTGTMGVTVVEVLSNGNLIVAGEKQIGMNKGTEYIRFSGMINPDSIATGNTVQSTAVADARVEYRTANKIDRAELSSMASRFFQSLLPF